LVLIFAAVWGTGSIMLMLPETPCSGKISPTA
jgi:hypothetical protein